MIGLEIDLKKIIRAGSVIAVTPRARSSAGASSG